VLECAVIGIPGPALGDVQNIRSGAQLTTELSYQQGAHSSGSGASIAYAFLHGQ
jgi:hypothetical protein